MTGVDRATGERRWSTRLDEHPGAMGHRLADPRGDDPLRRRVVARRQQGHEGPQLSLHFIGSMIALDISDGTIIWKTPTMPTTGGWAGGAVISVPAYDAATGTVYFTTDHHYHLPVDVLAKLSASRLDWDRSCFPDDFLASSIIALDGRTGAVKWSFFGSGLDV